MPLRITETAVPTISGFDAADGQVPPPPRLAQAASAAPTPIPGVSAAEMPPVAAAGVKLARFVLWIVVTSIAALTLYLLLMDLVVGWDVRRSYSSEFKGSQSAATGASTLDRVEQLSADFRSARESKLANASGISAKGR